MTRHRTLDRIDRAFDAGRLRLPTEDRAALTLVCLHANQVGVAPLAYIIEQTLASYQADPPAGGISVLPAGDNPP